MNGVWIKYCRGCGRRFVTACFLEEYCFDCKEWIK